MIEMLRSLAGFAGPVAALCFAACGLTPGDGTGEEATGGAPGTMIPSVQVRTDVLPSEPAPARLPFGAAARPYRVPVDLAADDATRVAAVKATYDKWKATYLAQTCGEGRWVVRFGGQKLTVSEAHGYGMLALAWMAGHDPDAKTIFDGMLQYFLEHQATAPGLMAWYQTPDCKSPSDGQGSATDGDLDIAYALLLAHDQWGSCGKVDYHAHARRVIYAMQRYAVARWTHPLLGSWAGGGSGFSGGTRVSDLMPGHFRAFAVATGEAGWDMLRVRALALMASLQAGHAAETGLLPDFAINAASDAPAPAPAGFLEGDRDGSYGWNACRIPWRTGLEYAQTGDEASGAIAAKLSRFFAAKAAGDPKKMHPGFRLDGTPLATNYTSGAFTGPAAVGALAVPEQKAWREALWSALVSHRDEGYYPDTLRLLSLIALSGHAWAPAAAAPTCPM